MKPPRTQVIGSPLEHGVLEAHGKNLSQHRQVLLRELLLQVYRVSGDYRLLLTFHGVEYRGDEVGQALADARAGLHGQVLPVLQRLRDCYGHALLLGPFLEVPGSGKQTAVGENGFNLFN